MTPTEQDLARKLEAHPKLQWMDGMEAVWPEASIGRRYSESDRWHPDDGRVPNLADPATQGCLWTTLREEASPVHIYDESHGIVVECHPGGDRERFTAPTLGEALARALLAAWEVSDE